MFWLEMLGDCEIIPKMRLKLLSEEARELTAIFTAAQHTVRKK